jgi:hypothetical protein
LNQQGCCLAMKKLLTLSSSKIYLICGLSLMMTLGAFWHHQSNQMQLDKLSVLNQGIGTCFNRISQTFTAMMIKDVQSPYLNRNFMALSDECLNETIKGINPFKKNVEKGYETLNQLISEVHWFHEKILKVHNPLLANPKAIVPLASLQERFGKMENFKLDLVDQIDSVNSQLRKIQINDEYLMGAGLILFAIALTILSLQDFQRGQMNREIETEAMTFLKSGNNDVGSVVENLVERALLMQGLPVTNQIFKDYQNKLVDQKFEISVPSYNRVQEASKSEVSSEELIENEVEEFKTSLKEILVSIQNVQPRDSIHMAEVRDVLMNVPFESFEQMMNSAINQLSLRRPTNKKVMISNQIHSDKVVLNLFVAGTTFTATELDYAQGNKAVAADSIDMNFVILKEMVGESGAQWHLENKVDRNGSITGMNMRFTVDRTSKEKARLISVTKGKKKDLAKELMN